MLFRLFLSVFKWGRRSMATATCSPSPPPSTWTSRHPVLSMQTATRSPLPPSTFQHPAMRSVETATSSLSPSLTFQCPTVRSTETTSLSPPPPTSQRRDVRSMETTRLSPPLPTSQRHDVRSMKIATRSPPSPMTFQRPTVSIKTATHSPLPLSFFQRPFVRSMEIALSTFPRPAVRSMEMVTRSPPPSLTFQRPAVRSMETATCSPPPSLILQHPVVGASLQNLGNTCFMNAVLQCLTHTVPFVDKIIDSRLSSCYRGVQHKFCPFSALKCHIQRCLPFSEHIVSPNDIAQNLSKISQDLQLGRQEDAHQFFLSLLEAVHTCSHDCTSKDCPCTLDEDSIVKQVFGGRTKSQLRCSSCGHCSDTYDPFIDLSIEIGDANNVTDALESFTKVEKMGDDAKLTCDGCGGQVSKEKQHKLDQAPEVLALHLKRFGLFSTKITKHVEYPLELDLRQFLICPSDEVQLKYDLYAVIVHSGSSPYSGHYFSIIRSSESSWYRMDDTLVTKLSEREVLYQTADETAYILFYIRKGSCWFSNLERNADNSLESVLDYVNSDVQLDSALEAGTNTSKAMPKKCETTFNYNQTSSTSSTTDAHLYPALIPSRKRRLPDQFEFDVFNDEPLRKLSSSRDLKSKSNSTVKLSSGTGIEKIDLDSALTHSRKRRLSDQFQFDTYDDEPLRKISFSQDLKSKTISALKHAKDESIARTDLCTPLTHSVNDACLTSLMMSCWRMERNQ